MFSLRCKSMTYRLCGPRRPGSFTTRVSSFDLHKRMLSNSQQNAVRSTTASGSTVYESSRAVSEYLLFHFGSPEDLCPYDFGPKNALNFPERTSKLVANLDCSKRRVLDVGCAVGGASFMFSKTFDEVVGIDFSQHFIDAANALKSNRSGKGYPRLEAVVNA